MADKTRQDEGHGIKNSELTEAQIKALREAGGIAAGVERYTDGNPAQTGKPQNDEAYGIASGYERMHRDGADEDAKNAK